MNAQWSQCDTCRNGWGKYCTFDMPDWPDAKNCAGFVAVGQQGTVISVVGRVVEYSKNDPKKAVRICNFK